MYSACVPTLIYAIFGQSRQLAVGPVAMVSLLVEAGLNGQLGPECTVDGKPQYEVLQGCAGITQYASGDEDVKGKHESEE